jgi:hypothetical protein
LAVTEAAYGPDQSTVGTGRDNLALILGEVGNRPPNVLINGGGRESNPPDPDAGSHQF